MQQKDCNLSKGTNLLKSLSSFILEVRNNTSFESIESEAELLVGNKEYKSDKERTKIRKLQVTETRDNEVILSGKELFIVSCLNVVCDSLLLEINRRIKVYENILHQFGIFFNHELRTTSPNEYNNCIQNLILNYKDDIDGSSFRDEVDQFIYFSITEKLFTPLEMYLAIQQGLISTFPNVYTI